MKILVNTLILSVAGGIVFSAQAATTHINSVYTKLSGSNCKALESNEAEGSAKGRCKGTAGYQLDWMEGDIRQSLNVIDPQGKAFPLELWSTVSSGFSSLGDKAEWRVQKAGKKSTPLALIVRYNVSENPEKPEKTTSYLVVSKITPTEVCVTDVVKPAKDANQQARTLADTATTKACKKTGATTEETTSMEIPIAGGMVATSQQDAEVQQAATFAAAQLGKGELDSVLEASQQVVAGMNYALKIKLKGGAIYDVVVYRDLQNHFSLTKSSQP
jgi:hypothetical protein